MLPLLTHILATILAPLQHAANCALSSTPQKVTTLRRPWPFQRTKKWPERDNKCTLALQPCTPLSMTTNVFIFPVLCWVHGPTVQRGDDPERGVRGGRSERGSSYGEDRNASTHGGACGRPCHQPMLPGGCVSHGRVFLRRLECAPRRATT